MRQAILVAAMLVTAILAIAGQFGWAVVGATFIASAML